ncbi:MAG: ATP-binding cassette domain-containing protein [Candidatus Amoebophilus sp.]
MIRQGRNIGTVNTAKTDEKTLAKMMVGREVILCVEKPPQVLGKQVLKIENLHAKDYRGLPALKGLSLDVKEGEIVGVAGIEGNGQTELLQVLAGLHRWTEGSIWLNGKEIEETIVSHKLLDNGVGHIPEDRHKWGLVLDFSIKENMIMGYVDSNKFKKGFFIDYHKVEMFASTLAKEYDVRTPSIESITRTLSGGNQQKVIVAREIARDPKLLIAAQPTRGLDVGAIESVHQQLIHQRSLGRALLLVSFELDEIMSLSDRIIVIYDGRIVAEFECGKVTVEEIGLYMSGGANKRAV